MDNDFFSFKSLLALIFVPFTYLIGWHYKKIDGKIDTINSVATKNHEITGKHGVRIEYLEESIDKIENKMDNILSSMDGKIDLIIKKLK